MNLTSRWLTGTILPLNLCPFALKPFEAGQVRVVEFSSSNELGAQEHFLDELDLLMKGQTGVTTLIGFPQWKITFEDFLDFTGAMEELLHEAGCGSLVQLVAFHPDFKLAGFPEDSRAHYPGKSPHPVLHLLLSKDVEAAARTMDGEKISRQNEERLKALTPLELQKYYFWR